MYNKIYILSDMHFGVRNNSVSVNDVIVEYFDWFIWKVNSDGESRDTRTLFVLGDVFNSRVSVNFMILQSVFDVFKKLSGSFSETGKLLLSQFYVINQAEKMKKKRYRINRKYFMIPKFDSPSYDENNALIHKMGNQI